MIWALLVRGARKPSTGCGRNIRKRARKRRRLGSSENSAMRLRPEHRNHVWSYDFVYDRTEDGRQLKFFPVLNEYTRESLVLETEDGRGCGAGVPDGASRASSATRVHGRGR